MLSPRPAYRHRSRLDGAAFYAAVLAQSNRWGPFVARGAVPTIPDADRRYGDMSSSLLTMYMNLDQGLTPEYGAGQFWNTYNINLPLDTLALAGGLLEWGHADEAIRSACPPHPMC